MAALPLSFHLYPSLKKNKYKNAFSSWNFRTVSIPYWYKIAFEKVTSFYSHIYNTFTLYPFPSISLQLPGSANKSRLSIFPPQSHTGERQCSSCWLWISEIIWCWSTRPEITSVHASNINIKRYTKSQRLGLWQLKDYWNFLLHRPIFWLQLLNKQLKISWRREIKLWRRASFPRKSLLLL